MSGYTPGPWVEDEYKGGWIEGVVEYAGCGSHEAEWTSEANKRLAFAAPELLEALILARELFVDGNSACAEICDEAIAKATEAAS